MTRATSTDLATHVKRVRARRDLSQEDIASRAGVSQKTIDRLERGENVRRATAKVIRAALDEFETAA